MPITEKEILNKENRGIKPFQTVFIATRGIPAMLAARVCEDKGIQAIIPYSFTDPYTNATRMVAPHIDKGWRLTALDGYTAYETYANGDEILEAALIAKADGIFLGYGFLSENAEFIRMCNKHNIRPIAPTSAAMDITGSKVNARVLAEQLNIPILRGTPLLTNPRDIVNVAQRLDFPLILKDPDTGGGIGNIVARNKDELERAFTVLRSREGNKGVYMEHYVEHAAHVEVQVAADNYGHIVSLGERDCTMQRHHQKFIEESPSPHISKKMSEEIQKEAVKFAKAAGYTILGTFEVLIDLDSRDETGYPTRFSFVEFNPRLQVENKVTQLRTGIDIVRLSFDLAEGMYLPFSQRKIKQTDHVMEFRVYAEDPYNNFQATPGIITTLQFPPERSNVIIDTAYTQGDSISPWFDPTVAHVIVSDVTREKARSLGIEILSEMKIRGEDVTSNLPFLIEALQTEEFQKAKVYTTFPEQWWNKQLREKTQSTDTTNPRFSIRGEPSLLFDPDKLLQNPIVPSRDPTKPPVDSKSSLQKTKEKTGENSAAQFRTITREGISLVLFELNPEFKKGAFGSGEEFVFEAACKEAFENNLPLVTILTSSGISQDENLVGLTQMRMGRKSLRNFPPLSHYNIIRDYCLGGTQILGQAADLQTADKDARLGITGPNMVYISTNDGSQPASGKAEDIYKELGDVHSAARHFKNRTIHIIEPDANDPLNTIIHIEQILSDEPSALEEPIQMPKRTIHSQELPSGIAPHENPDSRVRAWFGKRISPLWERLQREQKEIPLFDTPRPYKLPPASERRKILRQPDRPTAADLIDPDFGVFTDAQLLTTALERADGSYQYPATIAAVARLDGYKVLVLAHQSQLVKDEATGQLIKYYEPQGPNDIEYLSDILDNFGRKRKLAVIAINDTEGVACKPIDEDKKLIPKLEDFIDKMNEYPYPILSFNIGMIGSGGGIILASPFDYCAFAENALGFVADPRIMYWIKTGRWISPNDPAEKQTELDRFINQFRDATAEGCKRLGFIDDILKEGKGGAHIEPLILARELREHASNNLAELMKYSSEQLSRRRDERLERVAHCAAVEKKKL